MMTVTITQMINIKTVTELTGLSRSTIYELMDPNSKYHDPAFPKKENLTTNRVGWIASDINDWIESKIALRDQPKSLAAS